MARNYILSVKGWLLALVCAALAIPSAVAAAEASTTSTPSICSVSGAADRSLAQLAASNAEWNCTESRFDLSQERTVLRMDISRKAGAGTAKLPRYLVGRSATFKRVRTLAEDRDGSMRQRDYGFNDVRPGLPDFQYAAELPPVTGQTRFIYIGFEGAAQQIVFDHLKLVDELPGEAPDERALLLFLAVLCGMIMMPLAFNLAFYRILREPFLLWHLSLSVCALIQIVLTAGFYTAIIDLNMDQIRAGTVLSLGGMIVSASMFAANFIEPDKLPPQLRKALLLGAVWAGFVTVVHASAIESLGRYSSDLFYLGSAMMLPLFVMVIWHAIRRGSRAVWFQLIGWAPLFLAGTARVVSYFVPELQQTDANDLFHFGIALECIATALGVADRFMNIRLERDKAVSEARLSEALSERDPLTGLMNRRAIEPCFADLRRQGFDTFALIDLDRFKSVNDSHGHAVGDDVLRAVARAFEPDQDVMAMRLGGEEFVLLLRGKDAVSRAERRRMAIPARVSAEVPGLDRMVTASMGLIELPERAHEQTTFNQLYVRADRLLYEAKEAGRNRSIFERVVAFPERREMPRPDKSISA